MSKLLITGHKGFVGRHLFTALKEQNEVIGLDKDGYSYAPLKEYDGIIHLAAVSRVSTANADPVACLQTNIIETAKILEIPHKWFVFASSCEKPKNVYGLSKRAAEDYIRLRSPNHIILRLSNVYGPGMAESKLLPSIRRGVPDLREQNFLPFEHIHVNDLVAQIGVLIGQFERPNFKSYTMKMATGVAKTPQELRDVAASY